MLHTHNYTYTEVSKVMGLSACIIQVMNDNDLASIQSNADLWIPHDLRKPHLALMFMDFRIAICIYLHLFATDVDLSPILCLDIAQKGSDICQVLQVW